MAIMATGVSHTCVTGSVCTMCLSLHCPDSHVLFDKFQSLNFTPVGSLRAMFLTP